MVAGAGAMMAAAAAMAREQRAMRQYMRERAARRAAHADRMRAVALMDYEPPRADFPCHTLCSECGYVTRKAPAKCPACDGDSWMDLNEEVIADAIRDDEAEKRMHAPRWVKVLTGVGAVLIFVILFAFTLYPPVLLAALVGVPFLYVIGVRPMSWLLLKLKEARPYRWHMPLPLAAGEPRRRARGRVEAGETTLRAPLTGRECVAYRVSVLFDTPGDARPPEWVVQEIESVDFVVDGQSLAADHVMIDAPLAPVEAEVAPEALARYLRERGLFVTDGEFLLFESVVEPGVEVDALIHDPPAAAVVKTSS